MWYEFPLTVDGLIGTLSQPENEHFETRNSTEFARKLPNFGLIDLFNK